ncbi:MAG: transcriptional antiterminator [Spirochaetes bacterium GWF1_51_8]|nr:MAG: transcriptional antiterminator [Spirochaetes bacterium GWF1_51_8]
MKKVLFFVLSAFLFFTGCSRTPKLTFMVGGAPNEVQYWKQVIADFETKTGIKVTLLEQSGKTEQRLQSIQVALRGSQPDPDIMLLDVGWIGQIASAGWLESLGEYGIDPTPFFGGIITLADTFDGKFIALPVYVDGGLLYYRSDLLAKYGYANPPATWQELVDMGLKIQDGERKAGNTNFVGFLWQGDKYEGLICDALEYFASAGGNFLDQTGAPIINSEANIKALQFMVDLIHTYKVSPESVYTEMNEEGVREYFQAGNAMFERNWPYAWGLHSKDDSPVKGKVGIAPLPGFEAGKGASTLGGWHIAVSKYSDMKKEAAEFVKYVTSFEVQKALSMELGWNPGRMDVYKDAEVIAKNPNLPILREVFINAVPRPSLPYYTAISDVLQAQINEALSGKISPKAALDSAQEKVIMIIKEYGNK